MRVEGGFMGASVKVQIYSIHLLHKIKLILLNFYDSFKAVVNTSLLSVKGSPYDSRVNMELYKKKLESLHQF